MRLPLVLLSTVLLAACCCGNARAAVTLTVDLDTTLEGIQSDLDVVVGQVLTVGIQLDVGDIAGDNGINGYQFEVHYDTDEVALGPATLTDFDEAGDPFLTNTLRTPPFQILSENPPIVRSFFNLGELDKSQAGVIGNIAAGSTGFTIDDGFSQEIFEFTLTVTGTTEDNFIDVISVVDVGQGFIVSDNTVDPPVDTFVPVLHVGGILNVTAIPEPSSLAFLGLGGLYLGRRQLRRRRLASVA